MSIKLHKRQETKKRAMRTPLLCLIALLLVAVLVAAGCSNGSGDVGGSTTSGGGSTAGGGSSTTVDVGAAGSTVASAGGSGPQSGEVSGTVGQTIQVAKIKVTVKSLEETVNPVLPLHPVSNKASAPLGAKQSFYQASVRIENAGDMPLSVDVNQFSCGVGNVSAAVDEARSGPPGRSLLKGTSIDLLLTFMGDSGYQPELLFQPSGYSGIVRIKAVETTSTSS
jgi:hypothetical protein